MQIQHNFLTFTNLQQKHVNRPSSHSLKNIHHDVFTKTQPAFRGGIISSLADMPLSNSSEVKNEDIPAMVKAFTNSLILGAKTNKLSLADANMLMMIHATGLPIEIKDIKTVEGADENAIAFCFPRYDSEGNLKTTYLFLNFDMPVSQTVKSFAHEFTHCLQFNTKEAKAMMKELIPADNGTNNYFNAFKSFENYLIENNIHSKIDGNAVTISSMLAIVTDKLANPLSLFNFNNKKLQINYNKALNEVLEAFNVEDKNLALKYFKFRLELEVDAYKNGANALKKSTGKQESQPIAYDLISKMYSDCVKYIDSKINDA